MGIGEKGGVKPMNNIDYKAVVEILENFLKKEKTEILGISVGEEYQLRQAIENLIQENKELKAKYFCLEQNYFELHNEKISKPIITETEEMLKQYIPKSKVKEKIKELDKKMAEDEVDEFGIHSQGWAALDWTRDFLLEELLEEGE